MTSDVQTVLLATAGSLVVILLMIIWLWRSRGTWRREAIDQREAKEALQDRFADVIRVESEVERILGEAFARVEDLKAERKELTTNLEAVRHAYQEKKEIYDRLAREVAIFDERLAFAEMGMYEPHFDFDTSDDFKVAIERVRHRQKGMISGKTAVVCPVNWELNGSVSKGRAMMERNIRLTLRSFNAECDAAIANTRWNNANAMEKRIENARVQIDKHNSTNQIAITNEFFRLKLDELRLTHEYREKLKAEREERIEASRAAKEEQKLIREMESAEAEEARYERMLEKARQEAAGAAGSRLDAYAQRIQLLEQDLAAAHAKVERARAMAEMTRSGYVYIISNIGSFGPDFVKIGLTRRLDPAERVRELGDASVPFLFDTHAIIYSDDAPALERALHAEFAPHRVNATNMRKEFFRVSLDAVESAVERLAPSATFFPDIEAQEYHETLAMRREQLSQMADQSQRAFPASL